MKENNLNNKGDKVKPIDLYNIALGAFGTNIPEDFADGYDVITSIELLADALFAEKEFKKVEQLAIVLSKSQPDLYKDSIFILLPNLINYYLFKGNYKTAEMLMEELSNFPEYDFLLYIHLLNLLDAYGQVDIMNKITLNTITTARNLDEAEKEVLDSFIVSAAPTTKDEMLLNLRELFIDYLIFNNVAEVTAENIIDAILDYGYTCIYIKS